MNAPQNNTPSTEQYIIELENKNRMLTTFIDNSEAGMYVADYYTGEILFANRKMTDIGGRNSRIEDIIGKTCWELILNCNSRCEFCPHDRLLERDGRPTLPYSWEQYFPDFNVWLKIISQVIYWVDGRLAQMNTFFDITESKNMRIRLDEYELVREYNELQRNLQDILDELPVAARISDMETGLIVYANNEAAKLFCAGTPRDMISRSVDSFWPERQSDGSETSPMFRSLLEKNGCFSREAESLTLDGTLINTRITACSIKYRGRKSVLGVFIDLTADKKQQEVLLSITEKERTANRLKTNFLSNMSHEIRTPMNAIIGLTEIELNKPTPTEGVEVYRKINSSAKNLLEIVNDILDLSKIEANKIELLPVEFELEETIDSAMLVVTPRLEGKPVELLLDLSPDLPRCVMGDKVRVWQVLKNFLDNAAKFTQQGSITLDVREAKGRSDEGTVYITFTVTDTGIGMTEEQLSRAFLPYEQASSNIQSKYTGTGLGMSISKQLCELMGGSVSIVSEYMRGTSISFTIPFLRCMMYSPPTDTDALRGLYVLSVDNNNLLLEITRKILENSGAVCQTAQSGEEALKIITERKAKKPPFDIILLDYVMHGMNGLEAARKITTELSPQSKVLIVTAYEHRLEKSELSLYGITDLIEKPFSPTVFVKKLRVAMGRELPDTGSNTAEFTRFNNTSILICEDNLINQEVAAGIIEPFGIRTVMADNGRHGLEILEREGMFDLILMDLQMPEMDGFEMTRIIRTMPKYDNMPIISLTADAMSDVSRQCMEAGMNDYLAKPIDTSALHAILLKWIPREKQVTEANPQ